MAVGKHTDSMAYQHVLCIFRLILTTIVASTNEHIVRIESKQDLGRLTHHILSGNSPSTNIINEFSFGTFHALVLQYDGI